MENEGRGNRFGTVIAFLLGTLAGACLSLILAPTPGRETRKKIRDVSAEARDRTVDVAHKATETAKGSVHEFVDHGKERVHDTTHTVKAAVDAGKKAFLEKKAEITDVISHVGVTSDHGDNADNGDNVVVERSSEGSTS